MPIALVGGFNFVTVSAGGRHTCGMTGIDASEGRPTVPSAVYCWGDNTSAGSGNSWTTSSAVPVNVAESS